MSSLVSWNACPLGAPTSAMQLVERMSVTEFKNVELTFRGADVVRNCKIASNTAPLKFGTSSHGGFIDVKVTNCYFYNSPMGAIKLQLVDGGRLENVEISRIVMENVRVP